MKALTAVTLLLASLFSTTTPSFAADGDPDFGPYMADLQRSIKKHWFPPKGNESKRMMVKFSVMANGDLADLSVVQTSGLPIVDNAGLNAVHDAAPFKPLPSGSPEVVEISFTFNYNVFAGKSGTSRDFNAIEIKLPPPDPIGTLTRRAQATVQNNPTAENHYALADLYRRAGLIDTAKTQYRAALEVDPQYEPAKKILASMEAWKK